MAVFDVVNRLLLFVFACKVFSTYAIEVTSILSTKFSILTLIFISLS